MALTRYLIDFVDDHPQLGQATAMEVTKVRFRFQFQDVELQCLISSWDGHYINESFLGEGSTTANTMSGYGVPPLGMAAMRPKITLRMTMVRTGRSVSCSIPS